MWRRVEGPELQIALGILLLLSPVGVAFADVGEPTYEYEAVELSYDDGGFDLPPELASPGRFHVDNVACVGDGRSCALERRVRETGRMAVATVPRGRSYYGFVHLDGEFYRTEEVTENGTTFLTHRAVSPETALRQSSNSYDAAAAAFQSAVDTGSATTTADLDTPRIVATGTAGVDERFYYVYTAAAPSGSEERDIFDRALTVGLAAVGFGAGLLLVIRGQTRRLRRQWR